MGNEKGGEVDHEYPFLQGHLKKVKFSDGRELCVAHADHSSASCVGASWTCLSSWEPAETQEQHLSHTWSLLPRSLCPPGWCPIGQYKCSPAIIIFTVFPNLIHISVTGIRLNKIIIVLWKLNWIVWCATVKITHQKSQAYVYSTTSIVKSSGRQARRVELFHSTLLCHQLFPKFPFAL